MPSLGEVVAVLDELYDPSWAADWDAVGLVCGHPDSEVTKVLFAVDPVQAVVDEALEWGAELVVTHHPLFLRGTHSVAATTPKGRVVHDLLTHGAALHVCHTNADSANPGVSDALADVLGLTETRPLDPRTDDPNLGTGRIGKLPAPESLQAFGDRVAKALPATAHGVRIAGDPDRQVQQIAVCGGAGDSYLAAVRGIGVDAYVTADLRHHPASEASEQVGAPALVDVAHWASEWPWLAVAAERLHRKLAVAGTTVETRVSTLRTDPWTVRASTDEEGMAR